MKFVTLAVFLTAAAAGAVVTTAQAQDPVPPTPPARPAPAPATRPAAAPRAIVDVDAIRESARAAQGWARAYAPNGDELRRMTEDARELARNSAEMSREMSREMTRASTEMARDIARDFSRENLEIARSNAELVRESARMATELSRQDFNGRFAPLAAMAPIAPMASIAPMAGFPARDGFSVHLPPPAWAQGDPADSVYRVARDAFNRGEYGRAAKLFEDIRSKYPKSAYQSDSQYYEAYSRYRIGTTDELHTAAKLLEPLASKVISVQNSPSSTSEMKVYYDGNRRGASDSEVATLYTRINGALAQRGDKSAADKVAQLASKTGSTCDNEEVQVRVEAMNALSQMDANAALPLLKRVLDHKDECSAELRRRAVFMLGRRADNESAQLLVATAKSDPSYAVRSEAINALPRLQGDVGLNALEDLLRTETDERIQSSIVRSLMSSDNQKARSSMRALIDRKDAPLKLRLDAISSFNSDRATTDDAAYLRNLYSKADNDRLKEAIINSVGRMGGSENDKWVLAIAQNTNESSQLRSAAISRMIRSNVSIADLGKLYDASDNRNVRQQLVNVLASRKEPEATDKLIDIYRNSTDTQIKLQAINALGRKNDARSVELLNNIFEGKKP